MKPRPDLLDPHSPPGLEIFQLTTEPIPSAHIYSEAQIFTPDSRRFVLQRGATAHRTLPSAEHQYLLCDLECGGALSPLTEELHVTAPSVAPDGSRLYYFINETKINGGRLILKSVRLDGTDRETITELDGPIPGTRFRLSRPYGLSTISSDGERIAISGFFGDGKTLYPEWGLIVFDLAKAEVHLVVHGPTFCNVHPQYCRSLDPEASRDLLIQENHGCICDESGRTTQAYDEHGIDLHVIRDDGNHLRDLPWGRDGNEFCQGHQCWIGRTRRAITGTITKHPDELQLIEGTPAPHADHLGLRTPGALRNDLSRDFPSPQFRHFATDIAGRKLITDSTSRDHGGRIYVADLPETVDGPLRNVQMLLCPRTMPRPEGHMHPFLSPDGKTGFFNSTESGVSQAYLLRGW